jgi:serine/threonine protein kinase
LDIWSIGATAFDLLSGCPPFQTEDSTDDDEKEAILSMEPSFPAVISPAATSFIKSALQKSPKDRPTAAELLQHPWLSS